MNRSIHVRWLAAIAGLLFSLPLAAIAAPPGGGGKLSVTAATPSEAYQGEELDVIVSGSGFDAGSTVRYLIAGTSDASQVYVISVKYVSSTELKTHIRPAINALVTDYDIEVQTSTGRKGKGTTLFQVKTRLRQPPPPTYPTARVWHSFTDNGSAAPDASRLYMFGGSGSDWQALSDLWSFSVLDAKWTIRAWMASSQPSARQHAGLSCGAGLCVLANGVYISLLKETWVYTEASNSWSQVNCKRFLCPSARMMPSMAYDSARSYHLLFGGLWGSTNFDDTYTFSNATGRWTAQKPQNKPSGRRSAAATFVAGPLNRVVLFGGQIEFTDVLCDMWSWTGTNWEEIVQTNPNEGPCLHSHSMAWDGTRLIVTGGYVDYNDTPNDSVWTFTFAPDGKTGTWSWYPDLYSHFDCAGDIHPGARMAYDRPEGVMVFFGGGENVDGLGAVAYDDTAACQ